MMKRYTESEIEGDDQLWTSNAAPVLCLFQNKVKLLLKVMLISDEPLFSDQPPLVNTPGGGYSLI